MGQLLEDTEPSVRIARGVNSNYPVDFSGAASVALPATVTVNGVSLGGLGNITSTSATAFAVASTSTNYGLQVDESTASAITGLKIKAAASGAGVALSALGGTNEAVKLDGKGTGTVGLNTVSTTSGLVTLGNSTSLAGAAVNGALTATAQIRSTTATALGTSGTVSLDPTLGQVFTLTPTNTITLNAASAAVGSLVYLVVTTSGTSSFVTTFNTNFKSTGTLASGTVSAKVFTITFIGDGTNLNEVARTTAM